MSIDLQYDEIVWAQIIFAFYRLAVLVKVHQITLRPLLAQADIQRPRRE